MIRHTLRSIGLLIALACTLCAGPLAAQGAPTVAAAQPASISFFGMNTYFTGRERIGRDGDAGVAALIAKGRQIGVAWAREELSWGNIERDGKGIWAWDLFDRRLLASAQAGYGIVGMLLTTPAWARVADCEERTVRYLAAGVRADDYWCPPASPQDFADYVSAVVERYDGDGLSDAPGSPRVAVWQIWNEPNAWETWPGSPAEFAAIMQAGYAAAKAADPTATLASPGVYIFDGQWQDGAGHSDGLRFLDEALAARPAIWSSFDALAVHPYMPDVAPDQPGLYGAVSLWGRLSTARAWLGERARRYGGSPRPLWVSEVGWSTCAASQPDCYAGAAARLDGAGPAPSVFRGPTAGGGDSATAGLGAAGLAALIGKSEDAQASYLVRAHMIALALGVQHLSWFQLEDKFDGSAGNFWEEAAIFGTAAEGYRAKPAAVAYAAMVGRLAGARFVGFGAIHSFAHIPTAGTPTARFHLRFASADDRIIDVLWRNGGAESVRLPLEPGRGATLFDRAGNAAGLTIDGGAALLTLSESPLYLVQSRSPGLKIGPSQITVILRPDSPPQPLAFLVSNAGSGVISWTARVGAAWASLATASGQGYSSPLRLTVSSADLSPGSYSTIIAVSSSAGARQIALRLIVSADARRGYLPLVGR